jgi:hypothetical protein
MQPPLNALHAVVGPDGVLVLTLQAHPDRWNYSAEALRKAGINPVQFFGTDGSCASMPALSMGCVAQSAASEAWCAAQSKTGVGCEGRWEQAIADSHRRALVLASQREWDWTMITEDDVVPVGPGQWMQSFQEAWSRIPKSTKIVRFNWCFSPVEIRQEVLFDAGHFKLIRWTGESTTYYSGGCTGAYMVHRTIIPTLLGLFPCCCAVDCCFEHELYDRPFDGNATVGMMILVNLDSRGSAEYISNVPGHTDEYGALMQANGVLASLAHRRCLSRCKQHLMSKLNEEVALD